MGKQVECDATNEQNHDFRKSISERKKLSVMKAVSYKEKSNRTKLNAKKDELRM